MVVKSRDKLAQKRSIRGYAKQAESNKLLALLSEVPDYRKPQGKRHNLGHILYLSILAGLMGATDYKQISIWIGKHIQKEQIKKLLGVEFILTPKKSAISSILSKVDSEALKLLFREWIRAYAETTGEDLQAMIGDFGDEFIFTFDAITQKN
ncbi:MAG: transposase family protein [Campylobacterota bacterium]|nr:transposase family protein [Campylobacterota bacterium]